ncbi:hypothetical protein ABE10_00360, partial [Bacillus toyonensis]|nr:hypothetical protein [Bacillus toyonensis]
RVERLPARDILRHPRPEAIAGTTDVPVGQHLGEVAQAPGRGRRVQPLQVGLDVTNEVPRTGEDVSIEHVGRIRPPLRFVALAVRPAGGVRIRREEVPGVPERQDELAYSGTDTLLRDGEVAATEHGTGHEEPAHRIGSVAVEDLGHVRVVPQRLGHLVAVGAQHDAVAAHPGERRAAEERRGEDVHDVEPAARLPDVLDDEVRRGVGVEPLPVLERVVHLGVGHRTRVEPDIEDVLDAPHGALARRVVRVRTGQVVDVRTVQVDLAVRIAREHAEITLQLLQRAVGVDARVLRVVALPDRDRRTPVAVAADRPVASSFQPLAELPVLDVLGHPGDLLVVREHAVLDVRHPDEPARHGLVDERVPTPPAVRVGVLVALQAEQAPRRANEAD